VFCAHCGKPNAEDARFCAFCGRFPTQVTPGIKPRTPRWLFFVILISSALSLVTIIGAVFSPRAREQEHPTPLQEHKNDHEVKMFLAAGIPQRSCRERIQEWARMYVADDGIRLRDETVPVKFSNLFPFDDQAALIGGNWDNNTELAGEHPFCTWDFAVHMTLKVPVRIYSAGRWIRPTAFDCDEQCRTRTDGRMLCSTEDIKPL
jgi:hypothetical protein